MAYPPNNNDLSEAKTTIVNILKMEGYKLDSGSLFLAFKEDILPDVRCSNQLICNFNQTAFHLFNFPKICPRNDLVDIDAKNRRRERL